MSNNFTLGQTFKSVRAVTPSDAVDLPDGPAQLYVGVTGNVALIASGDASSVILIGVIAGQVLNIYAKRVLATGTTATDIMAVYDKNL